MSKVSHQSKHLVDSIDEISSILIINRVLDIASLVLYVNVLPEENSNILVKHTPIRIGFTVAVIHLTT